METPGIIAHDNESNGEKMKLAGDAIRKEFTEVCHSRENSLI